MGWPAMICQHSHSQVTEGGTQHFWHSEYLKYLKFIHSSVIFQYLKILHYKQRQNNFLTGRVAQCIWGNPLGHLVTNDLENPASNLNVVSSNKNRAIFPPGGQQQNIGRGTLINLNSYWKNLHKKGMSYNLKTFDFLFGHETVFGPLIILKAVIFCQELLAQTLYVVTK